MNSVNGAWSPNVHLAWCPKLILADELALTRTVELGVSFVGFLTDLNTGAPAA